MTPKLLLPILFAASLTPAGAELINVNFYTFTPAGSYAPETESALVGPAGGLATRWNQFAANSGAGLLDSTGTPTTVTFTTNFSEGRSGGATNTPMLRSTLTDFSRGATRTLTISGLAPGGLYDVWLASFRDSTAVNERTYGRWTANNSTASPTVQYLDNRSGRNGATFVEGYNYITFKSVAATAGGEISFTSKGMMTADGADGDYRNGLSGFQIALAAPIVPPEPLEFTEIVHQAGTDEVVLTWKSNPGEKYGLYWSSAPDGFAVHGTHCAIPAHATEKRTTLGPFAFPLPGAGRVYFALGAPDLSNPVLSDAYGSGTTVTLRFSEAIHPDSVADPARFSVTVGGTPVPVLGAVLDASGRNIVLTLGSPLQAATNYAVVAQGITTLAGRVIPAAFNRAFQTWDNNPDGVQVFILAGQSNMVGHGKTEIGNGNVPGAIGCLRYQAVNDTANYGHLLVDPANPATSAWRTRTDVKVWWRDSDLGEARAVIKGDLKIGYSQSRNPEWIGPEFGFGWAVGEAIDKPVLIIKTAWGGKSLHVDFRPPGAVAARGGVVGPYYTGMLDYVRDCLTHLGTEFPEFSGWGYRIAGVGWHQGWNDRVDAAASADYEANLVNLINDLRAEFDNPGLPFSITTTGMDPPATYTAVELAQLAVGNPSMYPGFSANVRTTDTRPFWRVAAVSPSSFGYHWNHNGETQYLNGTAMGQKMLEMLAP